MQVVAVEIDQLTEVALERYSPTPTLTHTRESAEDWDHVEGGR